MSKAIKAYVLFIATILVMAFCGGILDNLSEAKGGIFVVLRVAFDMAWGIGFYLTGKYLVQVISAKGIEKNAAEASGTA